MPDGNVAEQHDDFDTDSLFGSPPPSPGRGRSPSPLALPGGQNSVQNVGTLALPGSHLYSELPSVPPPAPNVTVGTSVARQRSQPPNTTQQAPPLRSSTVPPSAVASASRPFPPPRKKKRASRRTTPASDARPTPPPIELPSPTDPPPTNFLRNQQGLLGHAGLVSGIHPANLSLQRHLRGKTPQNPIVIEDEDDQPSIGRRPPQTAIPTSRLPVPSSEEILQNLVKQKNLIPVMDALVRLVAGSAVPPPPPSSSGAFQSSAAPSTPQVAHQPYAYPYYPYPYSYPYYYSYPYGYTYPYAASAYQQPPAPSTSSEQPQVKKRKLSHVPAGASEWDVPYPFPEGQGPPDYHRNWQKLRGQQLVEDLVGLVKSAARKAAVQKAQGEEGSKDGPVVGSVEYYRERVLRHYRQQGRYEGYTATQPMRLLERTPLSSQTSPTAAPVQASPPPVSSNVDQPVPPNEHATEPSGQSIGPEDAPASSDSASHGLDASTDSSQTEPPAGMLPNATHVAEGAHDEPCHDAAANAGEAKPDQTLEQTTDNTQSNIDDLLSIFNDLPVGDIDALLSSTDFSSINAEDFDLGTAFDMTGINTGDAAATDGSTGEATNTSATDAFDMEFSLNATSLPSDIPIDPELLALMQSEPPSMPSVEESQAQSEKPSVQTPPMASGSGAPPTPTLVGSPMSQVDYDPPTPEWNFQFPEPAIAGSERAGSEARSEQDVPAEKSKDKGKGRAVEVIDVDREDSPMVVDPTPSTSSRGSEAPDPPPRQFDIPVMPTPTPTPQPQWVPPPAPFSVLDVLGPLRRTLEAYLPAQRSRVPSLLVAPPITMPPRAAASSPKDREDILKRARVMRAQLAEEIERAKVELWETAMEGGCLAVLAKEREKLVAEKKS